MQIKRFILIFLTIFISLSFQREIFASKDKSIIDRMRENKNIPSCISKRGTISPIIYMALETAASAAEIVSLLQNNTIKGKKRSNIAKFFYNVTRPLSYIFKERFICPFSIGTELSVALSSIMKNVYEHSFLDDMTNLLKSSHTEEEKIKNLKFVRQRMKEMYHGTKDVDPASAKIFKIGLISASWGIKMFSRGVLGFFKFNKLHDNELTTGYVISELTGSGIDLFKYFAMKEGDFKIHGSHKLVDNGAQVIRCMVEAFRVAQSEGYFGSSKKIKKLKKEIRELKSKQI